MFGTLSNQINIKEEVVGMSYGSTYNRGNKIVAEAALMELIRILEFGDKGTSSEGDDSCQGGDISIIPKQQSNEVVDEVFEYVEIYNEIVERQWWASELYTSLGHPPSTYDYLDGTEWVWVDQTGNTKGIFISHFKF